MDNISAANSANRLGKPLHGGVALITGGSRGIGKAIARRLATLGAAVGICGRDEEKLILASRELEAAGAKVLALSRGCNERGGYSRIRRHGGKTARRNHDPGQQRGYRRRRLRGHPGKKRSRMGPGDEHEFEERFLCFARCDSGNDPAARRRHHQHQFAGRQEYVCGRRNLLRIEMGAAGAFRLHGRRLACAWNTRQRHLPGQRGDGFHGARPQRPEQGADRGRRGPCCSHAGHPGPAKLHQRSANAPGGQTVKPEEGTIYRAPTRRLSPAFVAGAFRGGGLSPARTFFLLTIVVYTTIISP